MTIYVITEGSYSDYRIDCLFTDKAKAERFLATVSRGSTGYPGYPDYQIEEYEADEIKVSDTVWFRVKKLGYDGLISVDSVPKKIDPSKIVSYDGIYMSTCVLADSEDSAKKIAIDRFTEYQAKHAGLT